MEIPLLRGRLFSEQDLRTAPRVAIIDELMARQLWPGADPLGKRLRSGGIDSGSPWMTVVDVVGRIKQDALDSESRIAMYLPRTQFPTRAMNVAVRAAGDPAGVTPAVRMAIRALDADLPVYGVRTMADRVDESGVQMNWRRSLWWDHRSVIVME